MIATTNGITVSGRVTHDHGDYWTAPSTDVDIDCIENVEEDSGVFDSLLAIGTTTARIAKGLVHLDVSLPNSVENWIISRHYEELAEALVDAY